MNKSNEKKWDVMRQKAGVSETDVRTVYLALEGKRSVRRVHAAVVECYGIAPSVAAIGRWIKGSNWAEEARLSDEAVVERVKTTLEERKAQVIEALSASTLTMIENIKAAVESGITPTDPQQLKAMVDAVRGMLQELAVQTGGVSDRTETVAGPTQDERDELIRMYDEAMRKAQLLH